MDLSPLKKTLAPLYNSLHAANRLDQAERIAGQVLAWLEEGKEAQELDGDLAIVLSYLVPVRQPVLQQVSQKSAVEACLVEQGWTPLRTRECLRSLERLPDKPASPEEKLVADAETMTRLGLLGFLRQMAAGGSAGTSLADSVEAASQQISRPVYTPAGHLAANTRRKELRELVAAAKKALG